MIKPPPRYFSIFIFILLNLSITEATFAKDSTPEHTPVKAPVTLDQIKKKVNQQEEGKIISIASPKNKNYFLIRILKKNGAVKSLMVDKKTAAILK